MDRLYTLNETEYLEGNYRQVMTDFPHACHRFICDRTNIVTILFLTIISYMAGVATYFSLEKELNIEVLPTIAGVAFAVAPFFICCCIFGFQSRDLFRYKNINQIEP